ncbi:MAG TPA: hypothetical protein VFT31_11380 [Kribbella sp.]|nr:hypothetical protein [Kribbella sp.]
MTILVSHQCTTGEAERNQITASLLRATLEDVAAIALAIRTLRTALA